MPQAECGAGIQEGGGRRTVTGAQVETLTASLSPLLTNKPVASAVVVVVVVLPTRVRRFHDGDDDDDGARVVRPRMAHASFTCGTAERNVVTSLLIFTQSEDAQRSATATTLQRDAQNTI